MYEDSFGFQDQIDISEMINKANLKQKQVLMKEINKIKKRKGRRGKKITQTTTRTMFPSV